MPKLWGSLHREPDVFPFGKGRFCHMPNTKLILALQPFNLVWKSQTSGWGLLVLSLFRLPKYLFLLHERMLQTVMWQRICLVHQIFCLGTFTPPVFTMRHLQFLVATLSFNKSLPYYYYSPNVNYSATSTINRRMNCLAAQRKKLWLEDL